MSRTSRSGSASASPGWAPSGLWGPAAALLLLSACAGQPVAAVGAGGGSGKVGVIEIEKVFTDTKIGKKAQETLDNFVKNRQALIDMEQKDLRRMDEDFAKQQSVLSDAAKRERAEMMQRRISEFQQKTNELNREIQDKQKEVIDGFRETVERAVAKLAPQLGLQVVVQKGRGTQTVYSEAGVDITAKVIEEMDRSVAPDNEKRKP